MKAVIIVLGVLLGLILLVVAAIIFGKAKIRIICQGKIRVMVSVLGIRFTVFSDEPKKKKKRLLHRCDNPDKVLKKELKRQQKAHKKKLKNKKKKIVKKINQYKGGQPDPNLVENLQMILALVKKLYSVTRGNIKIKVRRMHLRIASADAAKTAVTYGVVVQSAAYLLEWIETHFTHIKRRPGAMTIEPNFLSETTTSDIDISFSIKLRKAVSIGLAMYSTYKEERKIALEKARLHKDPNQLIKKIKKIINKHT